MLTRLHYHSPLQMGLHMKPKVPKQYGSSGLDKRQCTVQLTLFADGVPWVKPLVIFRGTGKHFTLRESKI